MRAVVAAHGFDLVTFAIAVGLAGVHVSRELNPTMASAYAMAGLAGVAAWKGMLCGTILLLVGRVRTRSRRPSILLGYTLGLVGAASNLVAIAA